MRIPSTGNDQPDLIHDLSAELKFADATLDSLPSMTLAEIATKFRTLPAVHDAIKVCRDHADWQNKQTMAVVRRGKLIDRDLVADTILPLVELALERMVEEHPESVTEEIIATVRAGGENVSIDVAELIRRSSGRILRECKTEVMARLDAE